MNDIRIFNNEEFGNIRTVEINGKPYFCGSDIASALGYKRPNDAISAHCRATVKHSIRISGKMQDVNFISEGDLYRLITHSKLESAERFEVWVFDEVLPTIRKHGMYAIDELIDNPDLAIKALTALKEEREKNKALQVENERMKPKEEFFDAVTDSKDAIDMGQVAKVLNYPKIGRNKLFEILRNNGVLQQNNQPYQKYVDCGYFRVIEQKYEVKPGEIRINIKTLVFQKGVDYIKKLLDKVA